MLLGFFLLHLLQRLVQEQGEVVEGRHHVLLVHGDVRRLTIPKPIERLAHVAVHQSDFSVDRGRKLRDAHAQFEQTVLHHHGVVFQFALGLAVVDVPRVLFVGEFELGHQALLFKRQRQDVFQQGPERVHVFAGGFGFRVHLHLFHLLGELLHLFARFLLAV